MLRVLTAGAFWLGGYDFNERGVVAVWVLFTCIFAGVMIFAYPGWDD